ncbi:MAG: endo-1,4-beta-xylanase [Xenococcaceae cyanobacterium]
MKNLFEYNLVKALKSYHLKLFKLGHFLILLLSVTGSLAFTTTVSKTYKESLQSIAKEKGLFYGAALDDYIFQDKELQTAILKDIGAITPENGCKWDIIRANKDFNFSHCDRLLDFARSHDLIFRGHTLVWHVANPDWLNKEINPSNADRLLQEHINKVMSRYRGKVHSWDVVNEIVAPEDGRPDGLRKNIWLQNLGGDYIEKAFIYAKKADPNAILVYNEILIENDSKEARAKRQATLQLLKKLKAKKVPIDALGIQAHLWNNDTFNEIGTFIDEVGKLGFSVYITELDVSDTYIQGDLATRDKEVAKLYSDFLNKIINYSAIKGIVTWGWSDKYSWMNRHEIPGITREDKQPLRPHPVDDRFLKKPAWQAIADALQQRN